MKIYLYYIGKPRDPYANAIADDFVSRISRFCPAEMREIRPDRVDLWSKHPSARKILLDPSGRLMDSKAFTSLLARAEMDGRDLLFLVGGADGLPTAGAAAPICCSPCHP